MLLSAALLAKSSFGNKTNGILEYISTVSSTDKDKNYDIKLRISDENKSYHYIENNSLIVNRTPFLL